MQASRHGRPEAGENPALLVAVVAQVAIDVATDVRNGLIPLVRIPELSRRLDQVVQIDPRRDVVAPPEHGRSVEEQRLNDEHHVHPLVVGDLALVRRTVGIGDVLVERQMVGVRHPADLARVVDVGAGEVPRHPALDLVADVLPGADDDGEHDEHDAREVVVEFVDEVVVREDAGRRELLAREEAEDLRHRDRRLGAARRGAGNTQKTPGQRWFTHLEHIGR